MPRVLIRLLGTNPLQLALRAAASGVTLLPGSSWTDHVIAVAASAPITWPEVVDAGPTAWAGLPARPTVSRARPAVVVQRRARSAQVVVQRRTDRTAAWVTALAENPVVPAVVSRLRPRGDAILRCAPADMWTVLPYEEQLRRHAPGDRLVVRLTTSLGGRATERDARMIRGLARRVMGADYCDPVHDVWPTWPRAPRLAFVVAPRDRYWSWVNAAATLTALSGRRLRVFREATPPSELVRQALRSASCHVSHGQRGLYVTVPHDEIGRWCTTYGRVLPMVSQLVGQPVWIRTDPIAY